MSEFKNIFIYVSDALRYDYIPDSIAEEGNVIPTLTPASYTPISFASMLTGLNPSNHKVRSFHDTIEKPTFFDLFENHCYYDHPDGAMCKNVFKNYTTSKELEEMEEPFLYIERALDTHRPYGEVEHGNEIPDDYEEIDDLEKWYKKGVESTEEHFWSHVNKLKELGLYEDTLVIFTSDHGELLGERRLFRDRKWHNKPLCRELYITPTVFLNHELVCERIRSIDVLPTASGILGKEMDRRIQGINVEEELPDKAESAIYLSRIPPLKALCKWYYSEGEWKPGLSRYKCHLVTLLSDYFDPLKTKIKESRFYNQEQSSKDEIEVEEIDF